MRLHRKWLVPLVAFLLIFGACADGEEDVDVGTGTETPATDTGTEAGTDTGTEATGTEAAEGPAIEIMSPEDGASLEAGDVTVEVEVTGFDVVEKLGEEAVEGEGHIHFFIDIAEADLPTAADEPAVTEEGTYAPTTETSHTWEDVEAGEHPLCTMLVDNDHTALEDSVIDCVTVTVE